MKGFSRRPARLDEGHILHKNIDDGLEGDNDMLSRHAGHSVAALLFFLILGFAGEAMAQTDPGDRGGGSSHPILKYHNAYRALHCVPPLKWSTALADSARVWAKGCARDSNGNFLHSGVAGQGENLAWGTALTGKKSVDMWYSEIVKYNFATPGFTQPTSHFTQLVWRNSTHLGCVVAQCSGESFWVCRYSPQGNFADTNNPTASYAANVPRTCK